MTTNYTQRLLIICPAARQAALNTWWKATVDSAGGENTFTVPLSADGNPPATAYWCSAALTAADLRQIVLRLAQMASLTAPAGWAGFTRQQQLDWLAANLPAVLAATGIRVVRMDNDGDTWANPDDALAAHGLQRIGTVPW